MTESKVADLLVQATRLEDLASIFYRVSDLAAQIRQVIESAIEDSSQSNTWKVPCPECDSDLDLSDVSIRWEAWYDTEGDISRGGYFVRGICNDCGCAVQVSASLGYPQTLPF